MEELRRMYILLYEHGEIVYTDEITNEMKVETRDGTLGIIRIDGDLPMWYDGGVWEKLNKI